MEKRNFEFEDWQKIIINCLALKETQLKFPSWKNLLQELNIHQKCETSLKNNLRNWYKYYCHSNKFPPQPVDLPERLFILPEEVGFNTKTKTVYDSNKNLVQIVLPPNIKKELVFEKGKQMLLNFLS